MTVLDVRNLGGDSAQSSPGGEQVVVQAAEGQHFITVTGRWSMCFNMFKDCQHMEAVIKYIVNCILSGSMI